MPPAVTSFCATDLEFVRSGGKVFCRSIALVPFARHRRHPTATRAPYALPASELSKAVDARAALTVFTAPPTVVSLSTTEVMRVAEVLPCGHTLLPILEAKFATKADELAKLKEVFQAEAASAFDAYRAIRREARSQAKEATAPTESDRDATYSVAAQKSLLPPPPRLQIGLTPQEAQLKKELQIRLGVTEHFALLDPYSVPNVRRLTDTAALARLYDCAEGSQGFESAVAYVAPLRAYGKGKGSRRALAALLRYHPSFTQAVLRLCFGSSADFTRFLEHCAASVEAALKETADLTQQSSSITTRGSVSIAGADGDTIRGASLSYTECATLEEFSLVVNREWSSLLHRGGIEKFFTYGNADTPVLHHTLAIGCAALAQDGKPRFTAAALAAGQRSHGRSVNGNAKDFSSPPRVARVPSDVLLSPFQARVVDVTGHPLFSAAGLMPQARMVPPLNKALESVAQRDGTAAALLAAPRPHDPLWDAQALACICIGTGVVR